MKQLHSTGTDFTFRMSHAGHPTKSITNPVKGAAAFRRILIFFVLLGIFLIGTTSCSRSISSGCGTWPVVKINKNQYRSDTWPLKVKNTQFANYKGYN